MRFLAGEQRLQELLLLVVGAVLEQGEHGGVVGTLGVEGVGAEDAFAELHLHQRIGKRLQTHATVLFGNERTPQALGPGLGSKIAQHVFQLSVLELCFCGMQYS